MDKQIYTCRRNDGRQANRQTEWLGRGRGVELLQLIHCFR